MMTERARPNVLRSDAGVWPDTREAAGRASPTPATWSNSRRLQRRERNESHDTACFTDAVMGAPCGPGTISIVLVTEIRCLGQQGAFSEPRTQRSGDCRAGRRRSPTAPLLVGLL